MHAYKAYMTIAEPYLRIQAGARGRNISPAQLLQQYKAYAADHPIKIDNGTPDGRTYHLNFER